MSEILGSQRLLQRAVNLRPELLRSALRKSGTLGRREDVHWVSPLAKDEFREYRDLTAVRKLGLQESLAVPLNKFWPNPGAVWDALGTTDSDRPVLVEAKAHIPEAASPGTKASPQSRELIERSLAAARQYFAPRSKAPWSGTFYQYANRIAHQYWLRKLNRIESAPVFIDFTNAVDVDGPTSEAEWRGATRLVHAILGLPPNLEAHGVYHAYVDARHLSDVV